MSTDDPKSGAGAQGTASADTALPFTPRKDDKSPLGDTDQHSKADHNRRSPREETQGGASAPPKRNPDGTPVEDD